MIASCPLNKPDGSEQIAQLPTMKNRPLAGYVPPKKTEASFGTTQNAIKTIGQVSLLKPKAAATISLPQQFQEIQNVPIPDCPSVMEHKPPSILPKKVSHLTETPVLEDDVNLDNKFSGSHLFLLNTSVQLYFSE